jgi:hypothetical protein
MTETPMPASEANPAPAEATPSNRRPLSRLQLALVVVGVVLCGGVGVKLGLWLRGRHTPPRGGTASPLPEAHPIWDALRAAADGDVEAYLACFVGPARTELESEIQRDGPDAFRRRIQEQVASAPFASMEKLEQAGEGQVGFQVTLERGGEKERFDYSVVRDGAGWRICSVVSRGRQPRPPSAVKEPEPPGGSKHPVPPIPEGGPK